MRKSMCALGVFLLFFGTIFTAVSRVTIKPEPVKKWTVVSDSKPQTPTVYLVVQGNLTQRDRFRVYFGLVYSGGAVLLEPLILINVTDPYRNTRTYEIPIVREDSSLATTEPLPEDVANYTGNYEVEAWAFVGVSPALNYLALQKMELKESEQQQYPYSNVFFVGVAFFVGGIGTFYLGAKVAKRKGKSTKRHFPKHNYQSITKKLVVI